MPFNSFTDYPMSWKPVRAQLKRPLYLSLAAQMEQDIAAGFLTSGTKLPPQRELADFLDINFTTVTRAYQLCERKGLIYAVTGRGTFVAPNAARSVTISTEGVQRSCIDLGLVASFEQCNHMLVESARKAVEKRYFEKLLDYSAPTGMPHHKLAGLRWMEPFGIQTDVDHLAIVSGAQNALAIALLALFEPGNRIAVDRYTFSNFMELAKMYHIQLVAIAGDTQGMLPEELAAQCRLNPIHGIFLMPSCCNPTTIMISEQRKQELTHVIRQYGLTLIEDDTYAFLTAGIVADYQGPMYRLLPEQTVYICGTSKSLCSGLRVAYMVFGDSLKEKLTTAIFNVNVKTSALDAEVITELILSGKAHEIVAEKMRLAETANQLFTERFQQKSAGEHPLSCYRWLPTTDRRSGVQIEASLQQAGVRVYHSDRFLSGPAQDEAFLRVSLATATSMEEMQRGFEILRQTLYRTP